MFDYIINKYNINPQLTLFKKVRYKDKYSITIPYMKCPYIDINCEWENYKKRKKRKFWYNIRRSEKLINESIGPVSFVYTENIDKIIEVLPDIFDLHRKRWSDEYTSSTFSTPEGQKNYTKVALQLVKTGEFELSYLLINNRIVSFGYSIIKNNVYHFYSHCSDPDPNLRTYSIGKLYISKLLESVFQREFNEFDFMVGAEPYKFEWTNTDRLCYRVISVDKKIWNLPILFIKYRYCKIKIYSQNNKMIKKYIKLILSYISPINK